MIGRFHRTLSHLARPLTVLLLVVGVASLGTAGAGQTLCPPDCTMHQAAASSPSCCNGADMDHAVMAAISGSQHSHPSPSPCGAGKLCFDSPINNPEVAASVGGFETDAEPPLFLLYSAALSPAASPIKLSSDLPPPIAPVPIYLRTCVYLI